MLFPVRQYFVRFWRYPFLWRDKLTGGYEKTDLLDGEVYGGRGFRNNSAVNHWGFYVTADVDPEQPLTEFALDNMQRMVEYCEQHSIQLILFTTPVPSIYLNNMQYYQYYVDAVKAFAQEHGLQFWDFTLYKNAEELPLSAECFLDEHHLNGTGAKLGTNAFCNVAARYAAGEDVSSLFYDTVSEKLTYAPDKTLSETQQGR